MTDDFGLPTAPIPGFLIPPEERGVVEPLIDDLFQQEIGSKTFEQWLQEARS